MVLSYFVASCPFSRGNANEESDSNENINNLTTKDVADPETTTPNNCKCTTICSCGVGCDPGLPIPLGETKDWCNTGYSLFMIFHSIMMIIEYRE